MEPSQQVLGLISEQLTLRWCRRERTQSKVGSCGQVLGPRWIRTVSSGFGPRNQPDPLFFLLHVKKIGTIVAKPAELQDPLTGHVTEPPSPRSNKKLKSFSLVVLVRPLTLFIFATHLLLVGVLVNMGCMRCNHGAK